LEADKSLDRSILENSNVTGDQDLLLSYTICVWISVMLMMSIVPDYFDDDDFIVPLTQRAIEIRDIISM
jgi:hypothetical protein